MELTAKERAQVKKVSRELLQTLKAEKLALDWRKRQQARAQVRVAIETLLDQGLPEAYTPEYGPLDNASPLPIGRSSDLRSMAMTIDRHGNSQYLFSSKKVNMMVGVLFIFAALGLQPSPSKSGGPPGSVPQAARSARKSMMPTLASPSRSHGKLGRVCQTART